jgi:hypothetical protein
MKILMLTFNRADATSWYRAVGIAKDLEKRMGAAIEIIDQERAHLNWSTCYPYDMIMIQRPQTKEILSDAIRIKDMGIPIWLDYDDDVLNIHPQHYYAAYYNLNKQLFENFIRLADVITVSTEAIKRSFEGLNNNIYVVFNGLPEAMLKRRYEQNDTILWRGSISHLPDLFWYANEVQRLINDGAKIKFMGVNPFFLQKYALVQERDLFQYFGWMKTERPRLLFVPLIVHQFNEAKSNIAWMEATMAGSVCVAQDLPEWQRPGVIRFSNPKNFYNVMKKAMKDYDLEKLYNESFDYIAENLTVEKLNEERINALKSVL